jgi:hypothetical protein
MPSSNSGFQRLPQAALSRSRFLRLAAGALLPAIGWRLPAAAAANPQLAQNSGATGTKDAAASGRKGAILVSQFGSVKIHSYLSPADGLLVNTQMIEDRMRSSSSMVSSCCHMPPKLRHTRRRSASPSIASFSRMRIPITGAVLGF